MNYVEWLRVRGCLKWTIVVLVVCEAILLFGRFTYLDIHPHSKTLSGIEIGDQTFAQFEASSKETTTKLSDGTVRTVIDNPAKGMRITIDDRGYRGKHIEVFQKNPSERASLENLNFGDVHFRREILPNGSVVKIDEGAALPEDLNYYFVLAGIVAMIVGTVLGAPFARENDGHLETALSKPVSRWSLALQTVGVDLVGIVAAWVIAVVFLVVGHSIFEAPNYTYGPTDTLAIGLGLVGAFCWYAMLNAATASMSRAYGAVLGIAWPVALGVHGGAIANLGNSEVARFINAICWVVSRVDPITYIRFGPIFTTVPLRGPLSPAAATPLSSLSFDLSVLAILALVYGALAIVQWQRVEA